ncbi:MAG: hypothetical protein RBT36_10155 [Desulfobulbus sp.]|jgi:hypothetical protein|nr:hypothetical protein [Desulfobulbus sp.]
MTQTTDTRLPNTQSLPRRLFSFTVALVLLLGFIYGALPLLTDSVGILHRMSLVLGEQDIDPSRYYYTAVVQVRESELYLRSVLKEE